MKPFDAWLSGTACSLACRSAHRLLARGLARRPASSLAWLLAALATPVAVAGPASAAEQRLSEPVTYVVTTPADAGPGSLRSALRAARESAQPNRIPSHRSVRHRIVFGTADGVFATPQVIELSSPLPAIEGRVEIDGFISGLLWKAYGVTISGAGQHRVLEVAPGGDLQVKGITISNGRALSGGGIFNRGRLVAEGITLLSNQADDAGGAIANQGGNASLINSTAVSNRAARGGGLANLAGELRAIHVTLHDNQAASGSGIFSLGPLTLANSILSGGEPQCVNSGPLGEPSTHNLFSSGEGCGEPLLRADPQLAALGYYNGPTPVLPITGRSPAINLGSNAAALDAAGKALVWDQRGNGDPRFAGGYVDIGAFEHQAQLPAEFLVDTLSDTGLRACTRSGGANCPLRAAVELSVSGRQPVPIRFDPVIFAAAQTLYLPTVPAGADQPLLFDGRGTGGLTVIVPRPVAWRGINGVRFEFNASVAKPGR